MTQTKPADTPAVYEAARPEAWLTAIKLGWETGECPGHPGASTLRYELTWKGDGPHYAYHLDVCGDCRKPVNEWSFAESDRQEA